MKRTLSALAVTVLYVCAVATFAWSQSGGSPTNPLYVRKWQGVGRVFKEVNCTTNGDVALVTAAEAETALSVYFYNTNAPTAAIVTICPREAAVGACDGATKGLTLNANTGWPVDVAVKSAPWSCDGTGGTTVVEVYIEKAMPPSPTPTSIPTPTPT